MSTDCTAEPPGELIWMATALAPRMEKAFSIAVALVESVRPGRSGVDKPMAPLNLSTGISAPRPVQAGGRRRPTRSNREGRSSSERLSMQPKVQTHKVKSRRETKVQEVAGARLKALLNASFALLIKLKACLVQSRLRRNGYPGACVFLATPMRRPS